MYKRLISFGLSVLFFASAAAANEGLFITCLNSDLKLKVRIVRNEVNGTDAHVSYEGKLVGRREAKLTNATATKNVQTWTWEKFGSWDDNYLEMVVAPNGRAKFKSSVIQGGRAFDLLCERDRLAWWADDLYSVFSN